jgi:hypothetical protein
MNLEQETSLAGKAPLEGFRGKNKNVMKNVMKPHLF